MSVKSGSYLLNSGIRILREACLPWQQYLALIYGAHCARTCPTLAGTLQSELSRQGAQRAPTAPPDELPSKRLRRLYRAPQHRFDKNRRPSLYSPRPNQVPAAVKTVAAGQVKWEVWYGLAKSTAAPATVYSHDCEPDTCLIMRNDGAEGFIPGCSMLPHCVP